MIEVIKAIAMLCFVSAGDQPGMNNQAYINESRQLRCQAFFIECLDRQPKAAKDAQRGLANCILERKVVLDPPVSKETQ